MPLREIACPRCRHTGYITGDRLPGILCCSACDFAHFVRDGGRLIHSTDAEALNARAPKARERKRVPRPKPEADAA
jgi:hypothetical protein